MGLDKLLVIADLFEEMANNGDYRWNQASWGLVDHDAASKLFKGKTPSREEVMSSCGTTACVAGWTVLKLGDPSRIKFVRSGKSASQFVYKMAAVDENGQPMEVDAYAIELLGLEPNEAEYLFHANWAPPGVNVGERNTPYGLMQAANALRGFAVEGVPIEQLNLDALDA